MPTKSPKQLFLDARDKASSQSDGVPIRKRANDLSGKDWIKYSISIWNDIRKDQEEASLNHPAIFPKILVTRLLACFTRADELNVLDPFAGSGSTLLAAMSLGKNGVGFEINADYVALANYRRELLTGLFSPSDHGSMVMHNRDARQMLAVVPPKSIDICITSPPYGNILTQKRTADNKQVRNYGDHSHDLGRISDYSIFIDSLSDIFASVLAALKPMGYCLVNVMDIRKGSQFFPFHSDLANALIGLGFVFDDLLIWDRRSEYNNFRPLGYPSVFRINKAHEYILIMQKPR